jgi:hypothetical protein
MVPQKQIDEFVKRLRESSGENLQSVILYGSAASGEFHPDFSNVNLMCILKDTSFSALNRISPAVQWWVRQKYHPPLVITREELERSTDVFSIEYLDMQQRHKVLFGDDPLSSLNVPMHLHRAQLEYELREKLILLRERLLIAGDDKKAIWELMLASVSSFCTLFRHALIALSVPVPTSKRETVRALASQMHFEGSAIHELLDVREGKAERSQFDVKALAGKYLDAIQSVTAAVDQMLDSPKSGNS